MIHTNLRRDSQGVGLLHHGASLPPLRPLASNTLRPPRTPLGSAAVPLTTSHRTLTATLREVPPPQLPL
ncbi:hypothetical protein E2C01_087591 [Portunus trituberculatus]|uniref:Uncharacterized protein n=1 Tax=Portunus trituberculatus TaxID=210409 RepID=A0A5B7J6Z9_PORTR|nr:hypothetical protein [Portunus trituberculatus]